MSPLEGAVVALALAFAMCAGEVLGSARNVIGIAEGIVIGLPHATGAGLVASTGVPARFESTSLGGQGSEYATADIFGGERQRFDTPRACDTSRPPEPYPLHIPRYALGGLIIALAFTMVTGYRAVTGTESPRETVRSVALAAGFLTVALWLIAYLVSAKLQLELSTDTPRLSGVVMSLKPGFPEVGLLPAAWAVVGGTIGARLHQLRAHTRQSRLP
jgi:hypothetical protein